jgi:hypothetical protein
MVRKPVSSRIQPKEEITGADKHFVPEEDNNINNDKDNNNDNKNNIDINNDKDIDIDNKKDIKKYIKIKPPKPVGYHCRIPQGYINALDEAKETTGFYKDELAVMAYDLLFKKLGIKVK